MPKLNYLRPKHKRAIEMKWQSVHYDEIARELGVSYDTVKSWFRKGGFLVKAYKEYSDDQKIIWKLQEKQQLINTLNGNDQQRIATNSANLPVFKAFQKLSPKEKDKVMERFNELNQESEKRINTLNGIKTHQVTPTNTK